jgi:Cu+-exporting ATPase
LSTNSEHKCYHCGDSCGVEPVKLDEKYFCCNGCKTVFEIINTTNLDNYYELESTPGIKPSFTNSDKYKFLDIEEIANGIFDFREGDTRKVRLFLPEIHCSSCIWLLENLHKLNNGVITSEVNFVKKEASITFNISVITFQELATLLDKIGYPPKFSGGNEDKQQSTSKKMFYKLGVAGFCFSNIMLFSFPEYLNFDNSFLEFRGFFSWLILGFSIPIILYAAKDYWVSAFKAIRAKTLNLDVPITLGIFVLYARSVYDIFNYNGPGYMDSFAGFVLFLLIGKLFQNKTYQALSFERDYKSYFPLAVTKVLDSSEEIVPLNKIEVGDIILIKNEEIIPADAILKSEKARIDYSFVTGESKPIVKFKGEEIFAGGKQVGDAIELKILKKVEQSYLTQLWNQKAFDKEEEDKGSLKALTDRLSQVFIFIIIIIAFITGSVWYFIDPSNVINIVTAVLIVACPCALALSIPFTFGNALRAAGRNKLYLKNADAIEQMGRITDIVFDKTGTITTGNSSKQTFIGETLTEEQESAIHSIVRNSSHPLSVAIYNNLKSKFPKPIQVSEFQETPGQGIKGIVGSNELYIGSRSWVKVPKSDSLASEVHIKWNNQYLGFYKIENEYRKEFLSIINELAENYNLHVLSGDNNSELENLKKYFPNENQLLFNQQPIDKLEYIKQLKIKGSTVLMLGDGLNDAGAIKQSDVGLVISDDVYNFSPACDGILDARKLHQLPLFLNLGKFSITTLKMSYTFSLLYNLVGLSFAVFNYLTPLVAAILMPVSSISVVLLTTISIAIHTHRKFKTD